MRLKFKITTDNAIIVGITFSFFMGLVGFFTYFLAINNFVDISFLNKQKSIWPEYFWWIGVLGFVFFCVLSLINLVLIIPKRLSFVEKIPVLNKLKPSFANTKLLACFFTYLSIIFTFFVFICIFDIAYSFTDKTTEFNHYIDEYNLMQKDPNYTVKPYTSAQLFLNGKKYNWYTNSTMLNQDGSFTDEFVSLHTEGISKTSLKKVICFTSVLENLNENFYFSIQTISTLGYGNITPGTPIGMGLVSFFVLLGLFATIMVFGVVLGEKDE